MKFKNRRDAGVKLVKKLLQYENDRPIILALPRGGVPVGYEVAKKLSCPLSIIIVRKIGNLQNPELGIGAIAEENVLIIDQEMVHRLHITKEAIEQIIAKERKELQRRLHIYRNDKPLGNFLKNTVIIVDDGLATGITARAAIMAAKKHNPKKIIFATPVCSRPAHYQLQQLINEVICLYTPNEFAAVGTWYKDFLPVSDNEVVLVLQQSKQFS